MTIAVCVQCGAIKHGAFTPCETCDYLPETERDLIYSLAFCDHHLNRSELEIIGQEIKAGVVLKLAKEQEDWLRPAARQHMEKFGPMIAQAWAAKKAKRQGNGHGARERNPTDASRGGQKGGSPISSSLGEAGKQGRRDEFAQLFPGVKIVTLRMILDTYSRISFTKYEVNFLTEFLRRSKMKGRDISVGFQGTPYRGGDLKGMMEDGFVPLHSPSQLDMGFLFLKLDGGRSLFGRQKAVYPSFVGHDDDWIVGTTFKRYELAITSIGNAYRGNGFK